MDAVIALLGVVMGLAIGCLVVALAVIAGGIAVGPVPPPARRPSSFRRRTARPRLVCGPDSIAARAGVADTDEGDLIPAEYFRYYGFPDGR